MSQFYISDTRTPSPTTSDDEDLDTLPFAKPLQRSDFLTPTFTPSAYLSTLSNRHQTLEDLRSELRARSQLLSRELLDLVNANYADFLTLGNSLRGGEERVEGVRVGLLGFAKEVAVLEALVREREEEVRVLVQERRLVRQRIEVGRRLIGIEERLRECEEGVAVEARDGELSDSSESEDEDGEGYGTSVARLRKNVVQYRLVKEAVKGLEEHPFVVAQTARLGKVRSTLLLDLSTALQQAKRAGTAGSDRVMQIMKVYADMEEPGEAVKVLKALKTRH
ncbi:oligomeric golgi complex component, COG2-domain-containing protein [Boeremia exigua]|uniref:oligomeric golgi complex component, COG2-domain-containing protein n=1 Tax=Boeremia exigua TaxID=749465 RepID=UPI001E8D46E9|nr:oligomeric golgi complex component, COG2-domain-containing protein [Boeremia exigua]KAH6638914.1 oligomeric golgi complex component, COG2-domain-containing protein [Boeremia exigua]